MVFVGRSDLLLGALRAMTLVIFLALALDTLLIHGGESSRRGVTVDVMGWEVKRRGSTRVEERKCAFRMLKRSETWILVLSGGL